MVVWLFGLLFASFHTVTSEESTKKTATEEDVFV